jgi:glycyl-tRNA synthetase beta chain
MGGHYARADGEPERVAVGVEEFYHPVGAKTPLPTTVEGTLVSFAGKIDTLAALFSLGLNPSGSEDPFALRRAGTATIRMILEKQLQINLMDLIEWSYGMIAPLSDFERKLNAIDPKKPHKTLNLELVYKDLKDFLWLRAQNWFQELGYATDEIQAVSENALGDLLKTFKRLTAVHALRANPEFVTLAGTFKRAANILKQAKSDANGNRVDAALLSHDGEKSLHQAMGRVEGSLKQRVDREEFEEALKELLALKPFVDRFFDTVRVMDAEESVKRNRLALLGDLVHLFKSVADISTIQSPALN